MESELIERTRRSLHAVAELVMAGPQYRQSGTIRLLVTPTGFRTKSAPALAVDDEHLLIAGELRLPLTGTTLAELAEHAGVDVGAPDLYHDGTGAAPSEPVEVDPAVARWLIDALNLGDAALRIFAPDEQPVLWPEHFDVSVLVDDVSYGVSPGDAHIGEPYAYISATPPDADAFWNESFGAARRIAELDSAEAVAAFFGEGNRRLSQSA